MRNTAIALLVTLVAVVIVTLRLQRARRRARRRVVEKPNSHYTSQLARASETRHRWSNIALDRMHEVNRGEVVRLLARVEATSVDALRPTERAFLDRMAELAGTSSPVDLPTSTQPTSPDPRVRPPGSDGTLPVDGRTRLS